MGNDNQLEDMTLPDDAELGIDTGEDTGEDTGRDPAIDHGDAGDGGDGGGGSGGGRGGRTPTVPLPEVKAYRDRLKAADVEINRLREIERTSIRYEERINFHRQQQDQVRQVEEARRAKAEQERLAAEVGEEPDPDDPAYQDWRYNKLARQLESEKSEREQLTQLGEQRYRADMQQRVIHSVVSDYVAFESAYKGKAETADYDAAFNHLAGVYANIYRRQGVPEDQLLERLEQERIGVIKNCTKLNQQTGEYVWTKDPAHVLYELAQEVGYVTTSRRAAQGDNGADGEMSDDDMAAAAAFVTESREVARRPSPRAAVLARSTGAAARGGAQGRTTETTRARGPLTLKEINTWGEDEFARHYFESQAKKEAIDEALGRDD